MNDLHTKNKDVKLFTLRGIKNKVRIVDVYDGDTVTIVMYVFNDYYKFVCRIDGIDSSEIKSKDIICKNNAIKARTNILSFIYGNVVEFDEIDSSKKIRNFLDNNVCIVDVECLDFDKYGRLLVKINKDGKCLAKHLIDNKLAYEYDGKAKKTEKEQIQILSTQ